MSSPAPSDLKLAILISGRGSNMEALLDACRTPGFPAQAVLVIASRPDAPGIEKARKRKIPVTILDRKRHDSKKTFEAALDEELSAADPDLICLAGFMHMLSPDFVDKWAGTIINIHPSLLPAYKGLKTHARVLEAGESKTGCTVHYVTAEMDAGPVIVQKSVPVLDNDTPEILAKRVLKEEHKAYPEAILKIYDRKYPQDPL